MRFERPSLAALEQRAECVQIIRGFFQGRGYLEVSTPILRRRASMEPHLVSFETALCLPNGEREQLYMHTSPEYGMKALLGEHGRSIFQIARVFRNEERSATHNHEFDMIEWYRVGEDYHFLMDETEALVRAVVSQRGANGCVRWRGYEVDVSAPFERLSVHEAFARYAGVDLDRCPDAASLRAAARAVGCEGGDDWGWDDVFHLLLLERVEPHLGMHRGTFLYDYPAELAALAKVRRDPARAVAERAELYLCGLELSNGFTELTDPVEQRARFIAEQSARAALRRPVHAIDEELLSALAQMPECTGNALGLDRLLMLTLGCEHISGVRVC